MPIPAALAGDLNEAREHIAQLEVQRASQVESADKLVEDTKAKLPTFNHFEAATAEPGTAEHDAFLEIDAAFKAAETTGEKIAQINATIAERAGADGRPVSSPDERDTLTAGRPSIGGRLVADPGYAALASTGRVQSPIKLASRDELRTFLAASDGSGFIPVDQRLDQPVPIPRRELRIADLITIASTDSNLVKYSYQKTRTPDVAAIAQGVASGETVLEWDTKEASVRRVATHVELDKDQLADAAQMRTEVQADIDFLMMEHTEDLTVNGDGTGQNFLGILNTPGISTLAKGADTVPDAIHKGMTTVRLASRSGITAVVMNPHDYERYVLAKDANQNYLSGRGPQDPTAMTAWGYPVVITDRVAEGTAVLANWRWAVLWVRSGLSLENGYTGSQLIENRVTIAAEYRAAFAVKQPLAFCTVTGLAA